MRHKYTIISVLLVIVMTGCAPALKDARVAPNKPITLEKDESLVFGKVIFIENGKKKEFYRLPSLFLARHSASLIVPSNERRGSVSLERDGSFFLKLPKATYQIVYIRDRCSYIYPRAEFTVPMKGDIFYLGDIVIDIKISGLLMKKRLQSIEIRDSYESARVDLLNRNLKLESKIGKSLVKLTKEPVLNIASIFCDF